MPWSFLALVLILFGKYSFEGSFHLFFIDIFVEYHFLKFNLKFFTVYNKREKLFRKRNIFNRVLLTIGSYLNVVCFKLWYHTEFRP